MCGATTRNGMTILELSVASTVGMALMLGLCLLERTMWESWTTTDTLLWLGQQSSSALQRMATELRQVPPGQLQLIDADDNCFFEQVQFQIPQPVDTNGDLIPDLFNNAVAPPQLFMSPQVIYLLNGTQLVRQVPSTGQQTVLANNVTTFAVTQAASQITLQLTLQATTSTGRVLTYPPQGVPAQTVVVMHADQASAFVPSAPTPTPPPSGPPPTGGPPPTPTGGPPSGVVQGL